MPVIGLLHPASPSPNARYMAGFLQGLKEEGYVDGQNVKIEYRWAHGAHERLPAFMADLVSLRVSVIVPFGTATSALRGTSSGPRQRYSYCLFQR